MSGHYRPRQPTENTASNASARLLLDKLFVALHFLRSRTVFPGLPIAAAMRVRLPRHHWRI